MSMKLYKVKIRGGHNTFGTNYNESYVVAERPDRAYQQVREFLHVRGLCFNEQRELDTITLLAEMCEYPMCRTMLFIEGNNI